MIPGLQSPLLTGGEVVYAVLDGDAHMPGFPDAPILSNGDLTYTQAVGTDASAMATVACADGPRHFEFNQDVTGTWSDDTDVGLAEADGTIVARIWNNGLGEAQGWVNDGNGQIGYGVTFDGTWGFLVDLAADTLEVRKNGTPIFSRVMGGHGPLIPFIFRGAVAPNTPSVETFNFGQNAWAYDPGAGWSGWSVEV